MVRILNFHEVHDYEWFNGLIEYLKTKYELVSMDTLNDFYSGRRMLKKACHITVDDGEKSFSENIFPILKKHSVPVTLFVSPKILKERSNYWFQEINGYNSFELKKSIEYVKCIPYKSMTSFDPVWILKTFKIAEIIAVIKRYQLVTNTAPKTCQNISIEDLQNFRKSNLITIGAHTMNHPILKNEDDASSEAEIIESIAQLSDIINHKIKYFAYPNGQHSLDFTAREEETLKKNGIELAVTLEARNLNLSDNVMMVPRIGLPDGQLYSIIKAKLVVGNYLKNFRKVILTEETKQRKKLSATG